MISIKLSNASVEEVFKYISKKTGCELSYDPTSVAQLHKVSFQSKNAKIEDIISHCLKGSYLTFKFDKNIIIIESQDQVMKNSKTSLRISGLVIDDLGEPLAGVNILAENTGRGTITNPDGRFIFTVANANNLELVFSFIGMKQKKVTIFKNGKKVIKNIDNISVTMDPNENILSDVVVTGVVNISKKSFTGSATTITKSDIKKVSPTGVLDAIQLFDPSFRLSENLDMGSNPNAQPEMYIRGKSAIGTPELDADALSESSLNNNPNLPIFILDGYEVPTTKIFDLDVERIETYTILKDAAATAMYGSRAANGVVVISTVAPEGGKLNVSYNGSIGLSVPDLSSYNLMNAREKVETERRAGLFDSDNPELQARYQQEYYGKLQNIEMGINTDWLSLPVRNAFSHKHSVYVDGGGKEIKYGIEFRYDNQNGVMKEQNREKTGFGLTLQYNNKGFQFRNSASIDIVNSQESPYGAFSNYAKMNPYDTYVDENGKIGLNMKTWRGTNSYQNPMYDASLSSFNKGNYKEFYDNFDVRWYLNEKINFKTNIALSYKVDEANRFIDPAASVFLSTTDKGSLNTSTRKTFSYDFNLNGYYSEKIGGHNINLVAGLNIKETNSDYTGLYFVNFPEGGFSAPGYARELKTKNFTKEVNRLLGTLGVFNYTYNNIYLFDLSGRIDGSSQFGSEQRYAPFYAAGLGLNIHNYARIREKAPWLSQFKIRGTHGSTGKVNFPSYAAQHKFSLITDSWYATGDAVEIMYMGNPSLKWEKTIMTDLGTEITLFNDILNIKYSYYIKNTDDLIADFYIPSSSGFTSYKENVGKVENKGHEFSVRAKAYGSKDLKIYLFVNGNNNKNKLREISNSLKSYNERVDKLYASNEGSSTRPLLRYKEGQSMSAIYGMPSLGIDPNTGKELFRKANGTTTFNWSANENVVIGDTEPKLNGSFGMNLYWKGFSVDTYFMYEFGGERYNTTLLNKVELADIQGGNCDKRVLSDRWSKPGDVVKYKNIKDFRTPTKPTSRFVQEYNMLSFSSFSIGYEFERGMIQKLGFRRLKLQLNARDLFTASSIGMERGLSSPYARTFNFSVNASF
ncbi:MAG: SusC/RagA family TonB-linked outer membrane protein [Bacteroidales bacterium]